MISDIDNLLNDIENDLELKQPSTKTNGNEKVGNRYPKKSKSDLYDFSSLKKSNLNTGKSLAAQLEEYKENNRMNFPASSKPIKNNDDDDIDDLLKEVLEEDTKQFKLESKPKTNQYMEDIWSKPKITSQTNKSNQKAKCYPLYLGGSHMSEGFTTSSFCKYTCNNLRCKKCDHTIKKYVGYQWKPSCDYLFFRNNISLPQKLQQGLLPAKEFVAYACQCDWKSVDTEYQINTTLIDNKWICGGHSSS